MEKVIFDGKEADVNLVIAEGKVTLKGVYGGHGGGANVELFVSTDYLLDRLAEKLPGQVDDAIIQVIKVALRSV